MLDKECGDFSEQLLEMIDKTPSRAIVAVHVFYVKAGQRSTVDILENGVS